MRIGELAYNIHVHRVHAWRLASAGVVPGTKKTKGGHFYFVKSRALTRWINFMRQESAFRRNTMARAYENGYGKETMAFKRYEKELWRQFNVQTKRAAKNRKEFKNYSNDYYDLFVGFFANTDDLIRILDEVTKWRPCKMKSHMIKSSGKRLSMLRDLINLWLSQKEISN